MKPSWKLMIGKRKVIVSEIVMLIGRLSVDSQPQVPGIIT